MPKVYLDYETRSKVDIKVAGAGRYATDPSTEILFTTYAVDDGKPVIHDGSSYPEIFDMLIDEGYSFCAHNAFFEYMIWKHVWKTPLPRFTCTMAKCSVSGLPKNLENAAKALRLEYQKDINGRRLINKFSKPQKDGTFLSLNDFPEDKKQFHDYGTIDVLVSREIDKLLPELNETEQKVFELTLDINGRGLAVDLDLARRAKEIAEKLSEKCSLRLRELTNDHFYSIKQTVRLKQYLNTLFGLKMEDVAADTIEEILPTVKDPVARELLTLRAEYSSSSVAKFNRIIEAAGEDARVRDYLIYHGAATGRWTSQIVQFQNLPRGGEIIPESAIDILKSADADFFETMYEFPMSALTECVRGVIVAHPGHRLFVADYAAIEARVLMWLADQKDAVRMFKEGRDIYVEMAKVIHKNPNLTKENKPERQLGKQTVLGCGYQMGWEKFKNTCAGYGIAIEDDLAQTAVDAYRNTYKRVVSFWSDLEASAIHAVRHRTPVTCGPVRFFTKGRFLFCQLPSGRCLHYYQPGIEDNTTSYGKTKKTLRYFAQKSGPKQSNTFKKIFTYGGKLCENITQAVARDIMADAMLRLEMCGYPVILSVHDEIVCEVPKNHKRKSAELMVGIMCDLPLWAEGCPITAEGFETERYRK